MILVMTNRPCLRAGCHNPEVVPHHHLGIPIGTVKNKGVVSPRLGRSLLTIAAGDLTQNNVWLPLTSGVVERIVLPYVARQAKLLASSMVQSYKMSQNIL
jgi:hypothetical protein